MSFNPDVRLEQGVERLYQPNEKRGLIDHGLRLGDHSVPVASYSFWRPMFRQKGAMDVLKDR